MSPLSATVVVNPSSEDEPANRNMGEYEKIEAATRRAQAAHAEAVHRDDWWAEEKYEAILASLKSKSRRILTETVTLLVDGDSFHAKLAQAGITYERMVFSPQKLTFIDFKEPGSRRYERWSSDPAYFGMNYVTPGWSAAGWERTYRFVNPRDFSSESQWLKACTKAARQAGFMGSNSIPVHIAYIALQHLRTLELPLYFLDMLFSLEDAVERLEKISDSAICPAETSAVLAEARIAQEHVLGRLAAMTDEQVLAAAAEDESLASIAQAVRTRVAPIVQEHRRLETAVAEASDLEALGTISADQAVLKMLGADKR